MTVSQQTLKKTTITFILSEHKNKEHMFDSIQLCYL